MNVNGRLRRQVTVSAFFLGIAFLPLPVRSTLAQSAPQISPSPYLLPWEGGKRVLVSQTQGGTHVGAMSNAIDFVLNRGDKVLASRSGKVSFREDRYVTCGGPELATRGNYVVIDHGDQTSALYLHLERIDVAVGQSVQQGDPIGTNGLTGWTGCSPHLHFQIQQNWGVWFSRSLPVTFGDPDVRTKDPGGALKPLEAYTSGNRAPSGGPATTVTGQVQPPGTARSAAGSPTPGAPPTATPTPSPTPTPSVTPSPRPELAVVDGGLGAGLLGHRLTVTDPSSVRERPATDAPRLAMILPGQEFEPLDVVLGQAVEPPELRWVKVKVESASQPGYLYAGLVKPVGGGSAVAPQPQPVVAATPSPIPTPAPPRPAISRVAVSHNLDPGQWQARVSASVREQPTRQSARIGGLDAGSDVPVLGVVSGEMVEEGEARWARIDFQGREAFVYFGVLVTGQLDPPAPAPMAPLDPGASDPLWVVGGGEGYVDAPWVP